MRTIITALALILSVQTVYSDTEWKEGRVNNDVNVSSGEMIRFNYILQLFVSGRAELSPGSTVFAYTWRCIDRKRNCLEGDSLPGSGPK